MNPILRNILAVIAGIVIGGAVNMGIVTLGNSLYPLPEGLDPNNLEDLKNAMANFKTEQFLFPFAAHALGTLAGAIIAAFLGASHKLWLALIVALTFLIGGITMVVSLGGPTWFILLDLIAAYLPMGWLGGKLGVKYSG